MDIAELLEREKKKEQAAEEERVKSKLEAQLRILDTERKAFYRKVSHTIKREELTVRFLDEEKDKEIDNYLATQSETIEKNYRQQERTVKKLVHTTDVVKSFLKQEKEATHQLEREIADLENSTRLVKQEISSKNFEDSKFRVPNEKRMNDRVELASGAFHMQLQKNHELEEKIDGKLFDRMCCQHYQDKLQTELDRLNEVIAQTMKETAELYEERDRMEATKIKLRDHLRKVNDRYERELLALTLYLSDDKKTDAFMRTKHKDITQYLIKQRELEMEKVNAMLAQVDEFQKHFNAIKLASGRNDMDEVVRKFLETEDDNFATFLNIGELLSANEDLRFEIKELRTCSVDMENEDILFTVNKLNTIRDLEASIDMYKKKSETCLERISENNTILNSYIEHVRTLMEVLEIPTVELKEAVGADGVILDKNILACMVIIENYVSDLVKDYYMLELTVRARSEHLSRKNQDVIMMLRVPSAKILPQVDESPEPLALLKEKEENEDLHAPNILHVKDLRDLIVKEMLECHQEDEEPVEEVATQQEQKQRSANKPYKSEKGMKQKSKVAIGHDEE